MVIFSESRISGNLYISLLIFKIVFNKLNIHVYYIKILNKLTIYG
jgi:hypothetical protein